LADIPQSILSGIEHRITGGDGMACTASNGHPLSAVPPTVHLHFVAINHMDPPVASPVSLTASESSDQSEAVDMLL
jgi:hypothetical protein